MQSVPFNWSVLTAKKKKKKKKKKKEKPKPKPILHQPSHCVNKRNNLQSLSETRTAMFDCRLFENSLRALPILS